MVIKIFEEFSLDLVVRDKNKFDPCGKFIFLKPDIHNICSLRTEDKCFVTLWSMWFMFGHKLTKPLTVLHKQQ